MSGATLLGGVQPSRRSTILLWIPGGMAATETFDPKTYTPYRPGMPTRDVLTTAPSISTAMPGVRIAARLERIAGVLDRATLVRSFVPAPHGETLIHARMQQRWLDRLSSDATPRVLEGEFKSVCTQALECVQSGERAVLAPFKFTPFADWDTHDFGAVRMTELKRAIDAPVAELVLNLERRGLLESTRVILASEFSRAPDVDGSARIESPQQYGLHAHFGGSASVLLFGAGLPRGRVIGRTAAKFPCVVEEAPLDFQVLARLAFE